MTQFPIDQAEHDSLLADPIEREEHLDRMQRYIAAKDRVRFARQAIIDAQANAALWQRILAQYEAEANALNPSPVLRQVQL